MNSDSTASWYKSTGMNPPEFNDKYRCTNCGYYALYSRNFRQELSHHCPNCGLVMKNGEDRV